MSRFTPLICMAYALTKCHLIFEIYRNTFMFYHPTFEIYR